MWRGSGLSLDDRLLGRAVTGKYHWIALLRGKRRLRDSDQAYVVKGLILAALIVALIAPLVWGASPSPISTNSVTTRSPATPSGTAARSPIAPIAAASPVRAGATAKPTPAPLSEQQEVISFLGDAIAWYRQLSIEAGLVEEPSETLYLTADQGMAEEIIKAAFDYAQARADLLARFGQVPQPQPAKTPSPTDGLDSRLAQIRAQMNDAQTKVKDLTARQRAAPKRQKDDLARQLLAAQTQFELLRSRSDFLTTLSEFERNTGVGSTGNGLQTQIVELQRSLQPIAKPKLAQVTKDQAPAEPTGLVGLVEHLLELRTKVTTIDQRQGGTEAFAKTVTSTRAPLEKDLLQLDATAQQLSQQSLDDDRTTLEQSKKDFEDLLNHRKILGAALLPLTKQEVMLRRYDDNLGQWRAQVMRHSRGVLHALILRLAGFLLLIGLVMMLAFIWRRLAERYVEDVNRRRGILKVRNATVVILIILLFLFNFTSELGALATVVGFAAAGIAVALQDVIMSIAGYFRLSGRFGIKHGDRVELQGVRGEVVEIGLTKLALLELGDSTQSSPTGRLVMIPNSTVFREKFVNHPASSLMIWRELRFTVSPDCDFRVLEKQLLEVVEAVFARYRDSAQSQLLAMQRNLNVRIDSTRPQSRVRLGAAGLEITLRYPVDARNEVQVADEISRRLLDLLARETRLRFVPTAAPNIQLVMVAPAAEQPDELDAAAPPAPGPASRNQS